MHSDYSITPSTDKIRDFLRVKKPPQAIPACKSVLSSIKTRFFISAVPFLFRYCSITFPLIQSPFSCYIHYSKERKKKQVYESKNIYIFLESFSCAKSCGANASAVKYTAPKGIHLSSKRTRGLWSGSSKPCPLLPAHSPTITDGTFCAI